MGQSEAGAFFLISRKLFQRAHQGLSELPGGLPSCFKPQRQRFFNHIGCRRADVGVVVLQGGQIRFPGGPGQAVFREKSCQGCIQRRAQGKNIRPLLGGSIPILLRGRIARGHGAGCRGGHFLVHQKLDQPKIDQDGCPIRRDFDIAGFDIPVSDHGVLLVQVDQGVANLDPDQQCLCFCNGLFPRHPFPQIFPLDIIHHQVLPLLVEDKIIEHPGQVGMPQARQHFCLPRELARILL